MVTPTHLKLLQSIMGRFFLLCLILLQIFTIFVMGDEDSHAEPKTEVERKGGVTSSAEPPVWGSAEGGEDDHERIAEAPRRLGKHQKHSSDESLAGGGVIIGGFATAIFAAVFCYIRVTRRKNTENPI